ncbi:hypothetical protein BUALT_Bualt04G0102100 [Buddleja alternifolia]|uniref:BTB domain-containing protein n=1 Tax=Buddleja alternifolia TaxID=168488 RepID=A0AAV6XMQ8_9LAMI|nr:hypothetical protein BUALT_Bualt04G0102100 [Buddleja alternifolia]
MDCRNEGSKIPLFPLPPPLPHHFNSRLHHKLSTIATSSSNIRGKCCSVSNAVCNNNSYDRLFDEGYRADVSISTQNDDVIYAHACILGVASPVFKAMFKKSKGRGRNHRRSISIRGVPSEAVRVFVRFLYSSCYEEEDMKEFALPLLVLSHSYVVPQLKRLCECWLENKLMSTENVIDIFQLALLCDAPRLSFICHRFILSNLKSVSLSDGWKDMKESHPVLEKEILESVIVEELRKKERMRKANERNSYIQLHEAMEALVHICRDGCRTIGPHDKILRDEQTPCQYSACKGLEMLVRHFAACKLRGPGGCIRCKRMWQILDLHSRLCANPDACGVPLCRSFFFTFPSIFALLLPVKHCISSWNFRQRRRRQTKKEDIRWRILVKRIVRSKSISGAPFFSLESS